jgi:AcrR family transcriptional regulator
VQRAKSAEAKAIRRAAILDATANWFDQVGAELTLDHVAQSAGLTRSTLYGYAATREELLLALTSREIAAWFEAVSSGLRRVRTTDGVARVVTTELLTRPRLPALLALCPTVFERNITDAAAAQWKLDLHEQVMSLGIAIDAITSARAGSGARFLLHAYAVVTGLHGIAFPPPIAAKAIADGALDLLRIDFETELTAAIAGAARAFLPASSRRKDTP